jgi:hypothetical protein
MENDSENMKNQSFLNKISKTKKNKLQKSCVYFYSASQITINVPLFKKMRDIIFFLRDNNFLSRFEGHFAGQDFLTP